MPFCGQTETQMNSYKRWNNIVGWIVFAIAAMTYLLTMEPSSSLWDCSEFIATSYKLEVGHPPGAPLFMLLARLATILAPSTYYVPHMVNAMNCLASAFCILFLFWTITTWHAASSPVRARSLRKPTSWPYWVQVRSEHSPIPSPTPSGSRPSKAKYMPSRRSSPPWWCGSCSNGRNRPTSPIRCAGSC